MAAPDKKTEPVEPVVYLLFVGIVFFTLILFAAEHFFNNDSQLFQVIAGVLTGFAGGFLARIKPAASHSTGGDDNSVNMTQPPATKSTRPLAPIDTLDA